jgi:hypothetical protein
VKSKIKIFLENQPQEEYKILWSKERFDEMESTLSGYWSSDIWQGFENPLKNKNRSSLVLKFSSHPYVIKTELKFVIYKKMAAHEWSWGTVHVNNVLKEVIDFFEENSSL